ncbi:hypothetical protein GOV11_01135 [Candidatus Woesearchaeota archaeon]|nr:hypothetical protein [Candidatus Woesearchaeota archaeon]
MRHRGAQMKQIIMIMVLSLLLIAACTQAPQEPVEQDWEDYNIQDHGFSPEKDIETEEFDSEAELKAFVINYQSGDDGYYGGVGMIREMAFDAVAEAMPMAGVAKTVSNSLDFSETNVQVQGIDEGDILKTDGNYIYTITENTLFIIKAYPGDDAEVVSQIEFESRPSGLFVQGDYLAVFGNEYDKSIWGDWDWRPSYGMTSLDIYDISDRDDPELEKSLKFEGQYFQSRMMDGTMYIVVRSGLQVRPMPMPIIMEGDVTRHVPIGDIHYYDMPYRNPQWMTVHVLDLESSPDIESTTVAVEGGQQLYMSAKNMYITSTEYINEWELRQDITMELLENELTDSDRSLIRKIERTDPEILTRGEKKSKIYQVYSSYMQYMDSEEQDDLEDAVEKKLKVRMSEYESREYTVIHKLEIGRDRVTIGASGKIPGTIINQFSLDEYDDVLRVAVTLNPWRTWWAETVDFAEEAIGSEKMMIAPPQRTETENRIYTLDEDLDVLDSLDEIAEGERIFAARFIGEKLYLVTFRQTDPFFVIDLSNPRKIEELGELKIPGFSRYLHPYDEDHIIGIGRDATDTGRQQGIKVSLFDVSDVSDPEEVASWVADEKYSQTSAEWEHKAFLFSKEKNLLVIPAYNYEYRSSGESYNGAMVFHIDEDDIDMRGIIDHSDGEQRYGAQVERSLYIEDLLYTKSPYLLRINELDDLGSVEKVELKPGKSGPYPIY